MNANQWKPDRVRGALWGLWIGNALGAPAAGLKKGHIQQLFERIEGYLDAAQAFADQPQRWRSPGLHTAPGQQALIVLDALASGTPQPLSVVLRREFLDLLVISPEGAADWDWRNGGAVDARSFPLGAWRGLAGAPRRAVEALRAQADSSSAGGGSTHGGESTCARGFASGFAAGEIGSGPSLESGFSSGLPQFPASDKPFRFRASIKPAPRAVPLAFQAALDSDAELIALLGECALPQERDARTLAAMATVSLAIRALARKDAPNKIEPRGFMDALAQDVSRAEDMILSRRAADLDPERDPARDRDLSKSLGVVASLIREGDETLAERTLIVQSREYNPPEAVAQPAHDFAPVSIPWILFQTLRASSFQWGLEAIVNSGGDSDTLGAIGGAILGARFGFEAIPSEWREGLAARELIKERIEAILANEAPAAQTSLASSEFSASSSPPPPLAAPRSRAFSPRFNLLDKERAWTQEEEAARQALRDASRLEIERRERRRKAHPASSNRPSSPMRPGSPPHGLPQSPGRANQSMPFAPPPEVWLRSKSSGSQPHQPLPRHPGGGKKRIPWKDERRSKNKIKEDDEE